MLGQRVEVMCGAMIIPLDLLKRFLLLLHERQPSSRVATKTEYQLIRHSLALEIIKQMKEQDDRTLLGLMIGTSSLGCVQKLDYVYALLGIATKGKDGIVPDYKASIPVLLNKILKNQHELQAPTLEEVADQCRKLERILGVDDGSMYKLEGHEEFMQTFTDAEMDHFPLVLEGTRISFWWSVYYGHSVVQSLLYAGGLINFQTLCSAAERGSTVFLKLLLDIPGRDVNGRDNSDNFPLYLATRGGHDQVVEMLLKVPDIDVNRRWGSMRMSSLAIAIKLGNEKIAAQILTTNKVHLLEWERRQLLPMAAVHANAALVKLLLDTGKMYVDWIPASRDTVLHQAVRNNDLATVELLLATSQIHVSLLNNRGETPLHIATTQRNQAITKLLLVHGADVNMKEDGESVLELALLDKTGKRARFLLDAGLNIDVQNLGANAAA
jgi:ankyrin repeat protein